MERLDDGVFRALLDRAIGPERAAKAYPAFFTAPTTAIRLNPQAPTTSRTAPPNSSATSSERPLQPKPTAPNRPHG